MSIALHPSEKTRHALQVVADARAKVKQGSVWQHKKGGVYVVTGYALHTDTGAAVVLYRRIGGPDYDPKLEDELKFARPLEEWTPDRFAPFNGVRTA